MKKALLVLAAMTLGLAACSADMDAEPAASAEPAPAAPKLAIMNAAGLDEALVERIEAFAAENLGIKVLTVPAVDLPEADSIDAVAKALKDARPAEAYCLVAMVRMDETVDQDGGVDPGARVGILNTATLKPADGDAETYGRRLEKETMRCAGLLAGMSPCVNPRCALWHYADHAGLDRKGRNFCPPCLKKFGSLIHPEAADAPAE